MSKFFASRSVAVSQIFFGISMLVCAVIIPGYFFSYNQGGISNYGTDPRTQWLFVGGFATAAAGTMLAGLKLDARRLGLRYFQAGLYGLGLLYLLVMLSTFPYKLSPAYRRLHEQAAIVLFVGMLVIVAWLLRLVRSDQMMRRGLAIFGAGLVLSLLSLIGIVHLLFLGQLLAGASFGYLLAHGLRLIAGRK